MKYSDYLAKNRFDLMPKEERNRLRQEFVKKKYGKQLSLMSEADYNSSIETIKAEANQKEKEYIDANMGPQLPVDKQTGLDNRQKKLYQEKIVKDSQDAFRQSGGTNTFSDFASKVYNAVSTDIKNSPDRVMKIANLFNPAMAADSLQYFALNSLDARQNQAREFMQGTGDKTISGTQFPLVLMEQGIRQSGPARLLETFSGKYDFKPGGKVANFGPEFVASDRTGRLASGIGSLLPDLPMFLAGPAKGFALSKMVQAWAEEREKSIIQGKEVSYKDMGNVVLETLKGYGLGKVLGVTGMLSGAATKTIANKISNALLGKGLQGSSVVAEKIAKSIGTALEIGTETTALVGTEGIMNKMMPTNDSQREHGFNMSVDSLIDGALMIGIMRAGNKLKTVSVDPVSKQQTSKWKTSQKLRDIGTDLNMTFKGGDEKIVNQLFQKKLQKTLTSPEIRDIANTIGKQPVEVIKSSPKEFQKIITDYNNKTVDVIFDSVADTVIEFDTDISNFKGLEVREAIVKELQSGTRPGDVPIGTKGTRSEQYYKTLDKATDNIYGEGTGGSFDTVKATKEFLSGRDKVINEGVKDGSKPEVIATKTAEVLDANTGKVLEPTNTYVGPISKGEVKMLKGMPDLAPAKITGKFQGLSKRIQTLGKKVHSAFVEPYRDAQFSGKVRAKEEAKFAQEYFRNMKFKKKEIDNVWRKMTSEQVTGKETLNRMGELSKLPKNLSPRETQLYDFLRAKYADALEFYNQARDLANMPRIQKVENYMPLNRKFTMREKFGLTDKSNVLNEETFINEFLGKDASSFAKSREFTDRAISKDLLGDYFKYTNNVYDAAYTLPVLSKMKKMISPMKLSDGKDFWIRDKAPNTYETIRKTIEYLEGVPQYENTILNNVLSKVQKNMGRSILGANYRSVASQAAASLGMLTEMPTLSMKNASAIFDPVKNSFALKNSRHLSDIFVDANVSDVTGKKFTHPKEILKHPLTAATKVAFTPMKMVDFYFRLWSWHTAYDAATTKGLPKREAIRFADQKTIDWNASGSKLDLPEIQRTPVGKTFTLFQTASLNQTNWMMRDILGIKTKQVPYEGSKTRPAGTKRKLDWSDSFIKDPKKAANVIKFLAVSTGLAAIYEKGFGLYSPIPAPALAFFGTDDKGVAVPPERAMMKAVNEVLSFFPFGGVMEWGSSSIVGAQFSEFQKFIEALSGSTLGSKWNRKGPKDLFQSATIILGVPGAKPFMREYKKFEKKQKELDKIKDPIKQQNEYTKAYRKMLAGPKAEYKRMFKEYKQQ